MARAFGLESTADVARLLGTDPALSQPVDVVSAAEPLVGLDQVLGDAAGLKDLAEFRAKAIDNAVVTIRGGTS